MADVFIGDIAFAAAISFLAGILAATLARLASSTRAKVFRTDQKRKK